MSDHAEPTGRAFWEEADDPDALRRFQTFVNAIDDGLYQLDSDGRFVGVNDVLVELTEYARDDLLGEHVSMLLGDDNPAIERRLTAPADDGDRIEFSLRTASGDRIRCEVRASPLGTDGAVGGTVGVVRTLAASPEHQGELQRKERRFEDPNILVGLLEPDGTVLDVNQTAMEYVEADLDEVTGEPFWKTPWWGDDDDVQADVREWVERAADGEYVEFEADLTRSDGEQYTVDGVFRPVTNDDGDVVSVIISDRDVTERKERERELEESERRYRTLIENFPNGAVALFDENLEYRVAGGEVLQEVGTSAEEIVGQTVWDRYPPALAEQFEPYFRAAIEEGETNSFELEFHDRHWEAYTLPVTDSNGDVFAGMVMVQDITERIQREQTLEETRRQLRTLIQLLPVAVFVAEDDGRIVEWNDAAEEIWGGEIARSDSIAEYEEYDGWWADTGEPVEPPEWPLARALRGEEVTDPDVIEIEGFDGERRTVLNHGMPVRNADGEVSRAVVTLIDITERREYQRKLKESNERLEQFAYAASHDLQEPLRMVSSYLKLIERRYADALDEDGEEFIEFAVDGAERMREMIQGLLEYSRIDTRGDPFAPVDLNEVLADVRSDLQFVIEQSGAEITAESLPRVEGDEGQIRQVLQNLLDNAIEYSGDEPPTIDVTAEREGSEWVISIRDEGIGIDPDDTGRIFEVFQSLHAPEDHPGTGIGLALCERIVERHGGDIWVESESGEGSTFRFTLPAVDADDE